MKKQFTPLDRKEKNVRTQTVKYAYAPGKTVFTFRCIDCHTNNKTEVPPQDSMLHCSRCGFQTVQTCEKVEAKR